MSENVSRYLNIRYVMAMFLIFCVLLFTLVTFLKLISTAENDAYIVNISGMQRMLSQRIAVMVREVEQSNTQEEADISAYEVSTLLETMLTNHNELVSLKSRDSTDRAVSREVESLYFSSSGIDEGVKRYTDKVSKFLMLYQTEGLAVAKNSQLVDEIIAMARSGLLEDLNRAVFQYQKEAETRISNFKKVEIACFALGVLLLLLELLFIFRPITRKIAATTEQLKQRNDELAEFAYRISHDLRAPIKALLGIVDTTEMLIKSGEKEKVFQAYGHMKCAITKIDTLADDIISLIKINASDIPEEKVNIKKLIEESVETARMLDGSDSLKFVTKVDIDGPLLLKRVYLKQALDNLISNAVKYRDTEKQKGIISIEASTNNKHCIIDVIDNGLGIPKDCEDKVFKMFQRFHPRQSFGSGLGLYLVSQNTRALGGKIEYHSLSDGSKFKMAIPFKGAQEKKSHI